MKKWLDIFLMIVMLVALSACASSTESSTSATSDETTWLFEQSATTVAANQAAAQVGVTTGEYDVSDLDASLTDSDMSTIKFKGDSIVFEGSGAEVDGNTITITAPGVYSVSGTLDDGQIVINTAVDGTVHLILNGTSISSSTTAPIFVQNADKTVITLADGTDNYVSDASTYVYASEDITEPNAAIFSNDDLTFNGQGSLTVNANYHNGIATDDDLKIISGSIMVKAVNDGIKGKDSISILDGTITINAGGDGMQSNNDTETGKGTISIEGGTFDIIAGLDGIQAETTLSIYGGNITISAGGGSVNGASKSQSNGFGSGRGMPDQSTQITTETTTESMKGLKAGTAVTINDGVINIDSADDAVHSNDMIMFNGGELNLTTGDDGMHADNSLEINDGTITINQSYEGIESAVITINGGNLHVTSSDDAINASDGSDASAQNGQGDSTQNSNLILYINDGYIYLNAGGDGLDSNGAIDMNGGTVIIDGPTNDGNGAFDYASTFTLNGGFLVAVGSSGMAMTPTADSTQYSVLVNFTSQVAAGTMLHFETSDGQEIVTYVPAKVYQSILISTPDISDGMTLDLYYGGTDTGSLQDGLYTGGVYTPGTLVTSLDITSVITGSGMGGGMTPGGGGGGGMPGGGGGRGR